ncbi:PREDICTED: uncharacterized protein At2g29880-like [Brassica oleracea var. oleracea]|uniref:uncharacterized protein At2g29880-like n=1 Tax=Brassica oleracea var. oleracea TaxID=109376 RepID=UPI0006A6DD22|nr:PREDICTED: uncharacterized protein At2g29880-like [Brassica oleracea var. oleracea]
MDDINLTEDPQQEKAKGAYEFWNVRETTVLIRLLVDGIKQGWGDKNGSMSKMTVEKKILPILNATVGCHKTHKHYLSRLKSLRKLYNSMQDLIRFSSGFGWDPISKNFTAPNQVWDDYEKAHPTKKSMRDENFEDYEDLQLIFEQGLATGKNAIGLGEDTDAPTFGAKDDEPSELDPRSFGYPDKEGSQASGFSDSTLPRSTKGPSEKPPPKKRAKGVEGGESSNSNMDGSHMEKSFNEMIEISIQVVSLIQQREERQQREANLREMEKKKNNIWEAIKEVFGLEEDVQYDTLKELHKWGMKDVFINMSIEERMGWIRRNVR